jgi:hypothetical protein
MQCITSADDALRLQLCGRSPETAGPPDASHHMAPEPA